MARTERYTRIINLLHERRSVGFEELRSLLEVSRATLYRDLDYLRDRLQAPIERDAETGRIFLRPGVELSDLPGLWLSAEEIHALLCIEQLLAGIDSGGLLQAQLAPLRHRLFKLLGQEAPSPASFARLVRVMSAAPRRCAAATFQTLADALFAYCQLQITYCAHASGETTTRRVSPLRLRYYRDNWYLDAWCHERAALRHFAVDAVQSAKKLPQAVEPLSEGELADFVSGAYGIFGGANTHWAILRFTAARARWVASEQWHPQQQSSVLPDGRYQLTVPYSQDHELLMDILKYGPDCEVVAPPDLREKVVGLLRKSLAGYAAVSTGETGQS